MKIWKVSMSVLVNFLGRNQFENMVTVNLLRPGEVYMICYQSNSKMVSLEQKYYQVHDASTVETIVYDFSDLAQKEMLLDKFATLSRTKKLILNIANLNQRYFSFVYDLLASNPIDYCFVKDNNLYYYKKESNKFSLEVRDCTHIIEATEIETFFGIYDKTPTYAKEIDEHKLVLVRGFAAIDPSLNIFDIMKTSEGKEGQYSKYKPGKYPIGKIEHVLKNSGVGYVDKHHFYILSSWENFFKGMWLEFYLYDILAKDKELPNLYRNVKIRDSDGYDNELDIVCTYKGRLKIISCKTIKSNNPKEVNTKLSKYLEDIHSRRDSIHMDVQSFIAVALPAKDIPEGIRARAHDDRIGIITLEGFKHIADTVKKSNL